MDIVTIIDICIAFTVIGVQVRYFVATRRSALHLEDLFPFERPMALIVTSPVAEISEGPVTDVSQGVCVRAAGEASEGFATILDSTNHYLDRSKGMAVNFLVLQDIVERVAESYEHAAVATVTLPLYIGLMGTFLGVIVGLLSLAAGQSASMEDSDLRRFLGGVLVAMGGSLLGLLLYVGGRKLLTRAQAAAGARKRDFYIFLQSELLPVASQEVSTALYSLEANLRRFNEDFRANLDLFGTVMEAPAQAMQQQKELLQTLQTTDIKRIIKANAEMLVALQGTAPILQSFLAATGNFVADLHTTREITTKLSGLLDRITTFENSVNSLGTRLSSEGFVADGIIRLIGSQLDALESRKNLILQYVDVQDLAIQRSITDQKSKIDQLFLAANQEISSAGQELSRSVAAAGWGEKATELFANVALLKSISERIETLQHSLTPLAAENQQNTRIAQLLEQMIASTGVRVRQDDPRTVELLTQLLAAFQAQSAQPRLGNLVVRMFSRDKRHPSANA